MTLADVLAGRRSWWVECCDVLDGLRAMPSESVHCVVTSPPYFRLRDYGIDGQIGLEKSLGEYVAKMVEVFREVRRVLRSDGCCFVNLGDGYAGSPGNGRGGERAEGGTPHRSGQAKTGDGLKPKDLMGVPWAVAFALRDDGWWLRSDIIYSKPNPMPESVTDRPTRSHEYVFLLTKSRTYFYDAEAVREPHADPSQWRPRTDYDGAADGPKAHLGPARMFAEGRHRDYNPAGRNCRTVWEISTQSYKGAHFATFPKKLVEPCVLAGSPGKCCPACGAPCTRLTESRIEHTQATHSRSKYAGGAGDTARDLTAGFALRAPVPGRKIVDTLGWSPGCAHGLDPIGGIVLDCFAGSGTTGVVALRYGRRFVGLELNPGYVRLARDRITLDCPMFNRHEEEA